MASYLQIQAFQDAARSKKIGAFESRVSPVNFTLHQQNVYGELIPLNGSLPIQGFTSGGKTVMELLLLLDGTGVNARKGDNPLIVADELSKLVTHTIQYEGSIHQPPFLKVVWGNLPVFLCRAESMEVEYKTFDKDGVPVRVDVKLKLLEDVNGELSKRQSNKQSPDLFHRHRIAEQETLPLISYQYYQDTQFARQIARANQLPSLYHLVPGNMLLIPPLKDTQFHV